MKDSLIDGRAAERMLLFAGALRSGLIDALAMKGDMSAEEVALAAGTDIRATGIVLEALAQEGIAERIVGDTAQIAEDAAQDLRSAEPTVEAGDRTSDRPGGGALGGGGPLDRNGLLESDGSLDRRGPCYRLTDVARTHLMEKGPAAERFTILHQANKLRGWLDLPEVIRTGRPAPRDMAKRDYSTMAGAMSERSPDTLDEIVEKCLAYSGPIRTMLDLGGSVGHVARRFSRCGVRATLLDREPVIPLAREFLGDEGEEIALLAGDFTQSLPPGPFDLVYMGNVSHIYGPDTNRRVFGEVFTRLRAGGTIAIQSYLWGRSPRATLFAVSMLQTTDDGGVWSEAQYREWLGGAGFESIEVLDLDTSPAQLVLGRRR